MAADAPAGLCAACLLREGLATDTATGGGTPPFTPPSPAELAPHFPQLEIHELVGRGGMGAIYKARQPALDRWVALKILPPARTQEPGFAERFNREARALARLTHPNVVAVHDFGQAGGYAYLVMEFVDGVNLRQLERAGRLSPRDALAIVPQVCDALQYAHDEGVVHRDIKPENILVDRRGRVKIADFGLARLLAVEPADERLTGEGQVMGTPHYMAPEQVEHPREVDHRADIFSLGVVFYELLTGELPLGKFPPPSRKVEIDVRLDDVVLRALEKEPARRYQQAGEVKTDVETIARTVPPPVAAPAVLGPRRWWAPLALGLFLLGTLGTLLLMTVSYRHELALIFGGLALALALVFGCLSWQERLSKGVVLATALLFIAGGVTVAILTGVTLPADRQRKLQQQQQGEQQLSAKVAAELASLLPRLKSGNLEERREAALRLHSAGPRAQFAVPNLIAATRDEDWQVRMLAAATLGYIGAPAGPQAIAALRRGIGDTDQRVAFSAALALTKVAPSDPASIPLLMTTLTNRPANDQSGIWEVQRREAVEALEILGFRDLPPMPAAPVSPETTGSNADIPPDAEANFPNSPPPASPAKFAAQVPPVVIATVPESGANGVDPALAEIRVTFSEAMRDGRWSWTAGGEASLPETTGEPSYRGDRRTWVLPVKLQPGKCYALWLNRENSMSFADQDGQPAIPYLLVFQTRK